MILIEKEYQGSKFELEWVEEQMFLLIDDEIVCGFDTDKLIGLDREYIKETIPSHVYYDVDLFITDIIYFMRTWQW